MAQTQQMNETQVVVGVFDDAKLAESARRELISSGFSTEEIEVRSGDSVTAQSERNIQSHEEEGGIAHFFRRLFGVDQDQQYADLYSEAVNRGSAVLSVHATDNSEVSRAAAILEGNGAIDIDERSEQWRGEGWQPPKMSSAPLADEHYVASGETAKIPVVEEQLKVGKRQVERGGVRVFARVRETPVEQTVALTEEHAKIVRRPVDRPANEADLKAFQESSIEVRETAEEVVIAKTARVVEEIEIGKETTQREERVTDTVRRTDVEVQDLSGAVDHDADFRQHWQSNLSSGGGSYDHYLPAYTYGSTLASSGTFSGRTWEQIEPEARSRWENEHPQSAWERFKASVRYGWEKVTGAN